MNVGCDAGCDAGRDAGRDDACVAASAAFGSSARAAIVALKRNGIAHKFAARRADFTQTLVQRCHVTLRIFPAYSFPRCDLDCTATSRSASTDVPRRDGVNRA